MRDIIEEQAESAREVLMPGANGIGVSDYGAIGNANGTASDEERGRSRSMTRGY